MRRKRKVYCMGCANLFMIGSGKAKGGAPMCVVTAKFISGPLRKKIDVVGVEDAVLRNIHNDCTYRVSVSLHAWELKRWLLGRLNNGDKKEIGEVNLRGYSVNEENKLKGRIIESLRRKKSREISEEKADIEETTTGDSAEEAIIEEEISEKEDVCIDGGIDDNDEHTSYGKLSGEVIQDS